MTVNYNNLRLQALYAYSRLATKLNVAKEETNRACIYEDDTILIRASHIQEDMDDLRSMLCSICCCYEEGNPDFADLSETINLSEIPLFNYEE